MTNKHINTKNLLKYLSVLFLCLTFANAKIGTLSPFLFAFYFSLLFTGFNEKISSVFTLISHIIIHPTLENFYIALTVVFIGLVYFYIHKLLKHKLNFSTLGFKSLSDVPTFH